MQFLFASLDMSNGEMVKKLGFAGDPQMQCKEMPSPENKGLLKKACDSAQNQLAQLCKRPITQLCEPLISQGALLEMA